MNDHEHIPTSFTWMIIFDETFKCGDGTKYERHALKLLNHVRKVSGLFPFRTFCNFSKNTTNEKYRQLWVMSGVLHKFLISK
jgi:hypothetical protein